MGEEGQKSWRRKEGFRRWSESQPGHFPAIPYPENSRFSIKQIAYLHAWCGNDPKDIVARYPRSLTLSQVHLALSHYFADQKKIDDEIKREQKFDQTRSLHDHSMTLPSRAVLLPEAAKTAK